MKRRLFASLLAIVMLFGILPTAAFAMEVAPDGGEVNVKVGETYEAYVGLPSYQGACSTCGYLIRVLTPDAASDYTKFTASAAQEGIVKDLETSFNPVVLEGHTYQVPSIRFVGAKEGTVTVNVQFTVHYVDKSIQGRCPQCHARINWGAVDNYKTYTYTYTVNVASDEYKVTYDANAGTDTVTGMPDPNPVTLKANSDGKIPVTLATPARKDYKFEGWSQYSDNQTIGYKAGNMFAPFGKSMTLYAVWTKCEHVWNEGVETKAPTCTDAGEKTFTCTACGATKTEAIPATGHTWGEWVIIKSPTYTKAGSKERTCNNCGEKETEEISKLTTLPQVPETGLDSILKDLKIEVECSEVATHGGAVAFKVGSATAGTSKVEKDSSGNEIVTCEVTINASEYLDKDHQLANEQEKPVIKLVYNEETKA